MTRCRVCRRPLLTLESQALGLGPVCRQHRAVVSQLEFEGLRPEGVEDDDRRQELEPTILLVAEAEPYFPPNHRVGVLGFRPWKQAQEIIEWPIKPRRDIRAPWWRRLWRWLRGGVR